MVGVDLVAVTASLLEVPGSGDNATSGLVDRTVPGPEEGRVLPGLRDKFAPPWIGSYSGDMFSPSENVN